MTFTLTSQAAYVSVPLAEVRIGWGEDTSCTVCLCPLPAGAPAWEDRDGLLCCDCAAAEGAA